MYPYKCKKDLADLVGISRATVQQRIGEMEASGRYDAYAVIRDGQIVMVNILCFTDWMRYRRMWQDKNLRKHIPPFDAKQVAAQMGWEVDRISLRRPTV